MALAISCPYCNTSFSLPAIPSDRRASCPRCGDTFPIRGEFPTEASSTLPVATATAADHSPSSQGSRFRAPILLLLGFLLALVGWGSFALLGRMFDKPSPGPGVMPLPQGRPLVIRPAELPGLKYLRRDCNVVLAVQPGAMVENSKRDGRDPIRVLEEMGLPRSAFEALGKAGLALEQIDHIVVGAAVGDQVLEIPSFNLVMVLRESLADEDKFLKAFDARRTRLGERTVHQTNLAGLSGLLLWKASPTVWVFARREDDLHSQNAAMDSISPRIREVCHSFLMPDSTAWLVVDDADWAKKPAVQFLAVAKQKQNWLPVVAKLRMMVLGLSVEPTSRLSLYLRTHDAETSAKLRAAFSDSTRGGESASIMLEGDPGTSLSKIGKILESTLAP